MIEYSGELGDSIATCTDEELLAFYEDVKGEIMYYNAAERRWGDEAKLRSAATRNAGIIENEIKHRGLDDE